MGRIVSWDFLDFVQNIFLYAFAAADMILDRVEALLSSSRLLLQHRARFRGLPVGS